MSHDQQASDTAQTTYDMYGLGRTSGQRGAEILAGYRADKMPSPETKALSNWLGRSIARLLQLMTNAELSLNYVVTRQATFRHMVVNNLPPNNAPATVVEIAAGFSPRGLMVATEFPHVEIIEIDLPDVMAEKKKRLRNAKDIILPGNLTFLAADLGRTPLDRILEGRKVNIIVAEGLVGYLSMEELILTITGVRRSLVPGGTFITDASYTPGMQEGMDKGGRLFSRQAGEFKTMFPNEDEIRRTFQQAGYAEVMVDHPLAMAQTYNLPTPLIPFGLFTAARAPQEA